MTNPNMKAELVKLAKKWRRYEKAADRTRLKMKREDPDACAVSIFATQGICYDDCATALEGLIATLPKEQP